MGNLSLSDLTARTISMYRKYNQGKELFPAVEAAAEAEALARHERFLAAEERGEVDWGIHDTLESYTAAALANAAERSRISEGPALRPALLDAKATACAARAALVAP